MSKRITTSALLLAAALVLGYIEALFFQLPALPGVKLGLGNIAVLLALYHLGNREALILSVLKTVLTALLFGNAPGMFYGLLGSLLAWWGMCGGRRVFGMVGVSVIGGVLHNLGQLMVACILTRSAAPLYYLPLLLAGGTFFGVLTALCAAPVLRRFQAKKR